MQVLFETLFILLLAEVGVSTSDTQFLSSVVVGWNKIEESTRISNFSRESIVPGPQGPRTTKEKWAFQNDFDKFESDSQVWLRIKQQRFILTKSKSDRWQMRQMGSAETNDDFETGTLRKAAFSISDCCLLDAVHDENYLFTNWQERQDGFLDFEVTNRKEREQNLAGEDHRPAAFEQIKVTVDPSNNYRIVNFEHDPSQGGVSAHLVGEYRYESDPYLPSTIKRTSYVEGREPRIWEHNSFSISHNPLPDSEFSLVHYGLADLEPASSPGWTVVAVAICGLIGLAIFFWRLKRGAT
ncbi:MAG: hypothetical protein KDB03_15050 [Planctomycetales bacterium]|nr:hypothetical protein [Planctomycetales bacterium]